MCLLAKSPDTSMQSKGLKACVGKHNYSKLDWEGNVQPILVGLGCSKAFTLRRA